MSEETTEFETEKYKFKVYKIPQVPDLVQMDVKFKFYRDIDSSAFNEIAEMLKHIGKWETLVKTGKALVNELGLGKGDV